MAHTPPTLIITPEHRMYRLYINHMRLDPKEARFVDCIEKLDGYPRSCRVVLLNPNLTTLRLGEIARQMGHTVIQRSI